MEDKTGKKQKKTKKKTRAIKEISTIFDLPIFCTALAVAMAHITTDELTQLAVFILLAITILYKKHDSCIPIALALILIVLSAFQLAFASEAAANNTAILAYYLLCVGVITQFIEYIRTPEEKAIS